MRKKESPIGAFFFAPFYKEKKIGKTRINEKQETEDVPAEQFTAGIPRKYPKEHVKKPGK